MTTPSQIWDRITQLERYTIILVDSWKILMASPSLWIHLILLPVVLLAGWHWRHVGRVTISLGVMILLVLLGYYVVYLITPHDLQWHVLSSIRRLVTHVWPVIVLWCMLGMNLPMWYPQPEASPMQAQG